MSAPAQPKGRPKLAPSSAVLTELTQASDINKTGSMQLQEVFCFKPVWPGLKTVK